MIETKYQNCLWRAWLLSALAAGTLMTQAASALPALPLINTNNIVSVLDYGAVGDGVATNTTAIQNAINAAAAGGVVNGLSGGTVELPPGVYLSGPLVMKSAVNLQVDSGAILRMLPISQYPGSTNNGTTFISGSKLNDIELSGGGAIDGQGAAWWPYASTSGALRPRMFSPSGCNRVLVQNITMSNSPMFHIAISGGGNITVQGVTVYAPGNSPNTDACDVSGTNILVANCNINVGDDDYTCGGGTHDVLLTNNVYGTGHGVSIGSYTDNGGVSNFLVINCTFNGTDNGIRLKSERGRGGLVQNMTYCNLSMTNVGWPLLVYSYYEFGLGTLTGVNPGFAANTAATNATSLNSETPIWHNLTFSNINATMPAGRPPLMVWGLPEALASNIVFRAVNITSASSLAPSVFNATNLQFVDCSFSLLAGVKTVRFWNADITVTNSTLRSNLVLLDGLTTNGIGNSLKFFNARAALANTNALDDGPLTLAASTFTVSNNLTLFPSTVLNFTAGTDAATLSVTGNLALGGTENISAGPGFTNGTYTLMTYGGVLSGTLPALTAVPAGFNCALDTNTAGQVRLTAVSNSLTPPPAPTNLVALAMSGSVALSWSPVATATTYNVKRSTTSGSGYITNATVTITNYSDTQVAGGTTYYYVVSALNNAGESTNSVEVGATPQTPTFVAVTTNVFNDIFTSSTLNSVSPTAPTASGTSYEMVSAKSWSPTPSLTAGHLQFGIGSTSSGSVQLQALFAATPVTLATIGDSVALTITFTNMSGLLTGAGTMGFGLYDSGQIFPVPGGLNGTATTGSSANAVGNAQTWTGYVGQLAFTGANCQIITRPAQLNGTLYNSDQDVVTSGSNSSSYTNNPPSLVGTASATPSVTLTAGNPYTEVLTITLSATNVLAITNALYAGTDTNGTLLSQFGGVVSGGTYLTNSFDALAVGWRETGSQATTMDINNISVSATLTVPGTQVSLIPTNLIYQVAGNQLQLSWPADHLGWRLQTQTNDLSIGIGTNWVTVPNSTNVTSASLEINATNGCVLFRMVYP